MKKADLAVLAIIHVLFVPFFLLPSLVNTYMSINVAHPYMMAFVKFAVLATLGEMLALRIKSGHYYTKGFGVFPKMVVWG
ncbi:MAG: hypothetical protein LBQ64_01635, partial [Bacteroidales bacterium]|nr:hypothetical protein [Bacteroidales bacterium]